MFSSQLGRVARASSALGPHTPTTARAATASLTTCASSSFQPKQRRLSSSKASSSPNGSRNNSSGPKALAEPAESEASASTKSSTSSGKRGSGRRARDATDKPKSKKAANTQVDGAFEALPRVAGTGHLHPLDVSLSSFFSLHRPLALNTPIPPTTSQESFASLFQPKSKSSAQSPSDVIYTLSNTVDALEAQSEQHQNQQDSGDLRWQVVQESASNSSDAARHLDGAPRAKTLEEIVSQLRPFQAPPPPAAPVSTSKAAAKKAKNLDETPKKSFQTTITVTENTSQDGIKYYTASTTPMVRIPDSHSPTPIQDAVRKQPFLERMRQRQLEYEDYRAEREGEDWGMHLISVKRQRKLKMKKHKYKKLMKRTRNLRRRLDRN